MFGYILSVTLVLITTVTAQNAKFLAQKPASMVPCTLKNTSVCLATNLEVIFREFKDELPGLNTISGTDPITLEKLIIRSNVNSTINVNAEVINAKIIGVSASKISNAKFNPEKNTVSFDIALPKLRLIGNYSGSGSILGFTGQSSGKIVLAGENILYKMAFVCKRRYENNYTFFDIQKFKGLVADISRLQFNLENLFNGQKELEDSVNVAINENWRSLYEAMYPSINDALNQAFGNHLKVYFSYIPGQYVINDIPNSA